MAKRYTPALEGLETRQALAASPSPAGLAAAAPDPNQAVIVAQVQWAPFAFSNVPGAVAPASAAGSSGPPAPGDASQPPIAPSAGNVPAAFASTAAGSSSPRATAPSQGNSSGPDRGDGTLKDAPLSPGKSAAPANSASADDRFLKTADESADRTRAAFPSP